MLKNFNYGDKRGRTDRREGKEKENLQELKRRISTRTRNIFLMSVFAIFLQQRISCWSLPRFYHKNMYKDFIRQKLELGTEEPVTKNLSLKKTRFPFCYQITTNIDEICNNIKVLENYHFLYKHCKKRSLQYATTLQRRYLCRLSLKTKMHQLTKWLMKRDTFMFFIVKYVTSNNLTGTYLLKYKIL